MTLAASNAMIGGTDVTEPCSSGRCATALVKLRRKGLQNEVASNFVCRQREDDPSSVRCVAVRVVMIL